MEIEWEKYPHNHFISWNSATSECSEFKDGWRLPTISELQEAYKNKVEGFKYAIYWSSEEIKDLDHCAAFFSFRTGESGYCVKFDYKNMNVRYVRNLN